MAGKKKTKKIEGKKDYTYELDVAKRLEMLFIEKKNLEDCVINAKKKLLKEKNPENIKFFEGVVTKSAEHITEVNDRISLLSSQARIIRCGEKQVEFLRKEKRLLEEELANAYCPKCSSPDLKITKILKIECRKCGRERMITSRLDEDRT